MASCFSTYLDWSELDISVTVFSRLLAALYLNHITVFYLIPKTNLCIDRTCVLTTDYSTLINKMPYSGASATNNLKVVWSRDGHFKQKYYTQSLHQYTQTHNYRLPHQNHFGGGLTSNTEDSICATATALLVHLVLHYVTLGYRAWDLSQELCNALWHHLIQQPDPCVV